MNYQQHFSERISSYLQQLKNELDEDLPRVGELIPEVTLGQADSFVENVSGIVVTYHNLFHRETKRSPSGGNGTSYYHRHKQLMEYDAKIEAAVPAIFEKEGYITAALVQQQVGIDETDAGKRLKLLSKKYKWKIKQDPQHPEMIRYSPTRASKAAGESPAS